MVFEEALIDKDHVQREVLLLSFDGDLSTLVASNPSWHLRAPELLTGDPDEVGFIATAFAPDDDARGEA